MQVTPLEAWDIMVFLRRQGRWHQELLTELQACVSRYQLDRELPGDGRRGFMRRTYTCPFFKPQALGCTISPERKPVGCLAFNPRRSGIMDGQDCGHDMADQHFDARWETRNARCRSRWNISWEKKPIPLALIDFFELFPGEG